MILIDKHMHPFEKMKTKDGMRKFVEQAGKIGLKEITFTEHAPYIPGLTSTGMTEEELEAYVAYTMELRSEIQAPKISLGLEVDWHSSNANYARQLISKYDFDYILGSVHVHADVYRDEISNMDMREIGTLALRQNIEAVESGMFDTIAHLDFFRWLSDKDRFGQWSGDYHPEDYHDLFHKLFSSMEKHATSLEVNSSGLYKVFKSVLPCPEVLEIADSYNLSYVYGSDAHESEFVGSGRQEVIDNISQKQLRALHGAQL